MSGGWGSVQGNQWRDYGRRRAVLVVALGTQQASRAGQRSGYKTLPSNAEGTGSIPGQGTKIPRAAVKKKKTGVGCRKGAGGTWDTRLCFKDGSWLQEAISCLHSLHLHQAPSHLAPCSFPNTASSATTCTPAHSPRGHQSSWDSAPNSASPRQWLTCLAEPTRCSPNSHFPLFCSGGQQTSGQRQVVNTLALGLPRWLSGEEFTCQRRFHPWSGKIPPPAERLTHAPQLRSPSARAPSSATREATAMRSSHTTTREEPARQPRPSTAKNKWTKWFLKYFRLCRQLRSLSQLLTSSVVIWKQLLTIHKWMGVARFPYTLFSKCYWFLLRYS